MSPKKSKKLTVKASGFFSRLVNIIRLPQSISLIFLRASHNSVKHFLIFGPVTSPNGDDFLFPLCILGAVSKESHGPPRVFERFSTSLECSCYLHLFSGCQEARKLSFPAGCFCSDCFTCTAGTEWMYGNAPDINWCPPVCVAY